MYTVQYHDEPASAPFIVAATAGMDGLVDISSCALPAAAFVPAHVPRACH